MTHQLHSNQRASSFQREGENADPPTNWMDLLEFLGEQGFEGMAEAMQLLINEAENLEWCAVLQAAPFDCEQHGITIPWIKGRTVWAVDVRRLESKPKYKLRAGSVRGMMLYPQDVQDLTKLVLVCEGERDRNHDRCR